MKLMDLLDDLDIVVDRDLLKEALTHSSYVNEHPNHGPPNERLEFLGDAVLDLVVSEHLFRLKPARDEGTLSSLRASIVRTETLARAAENLQLGQMLQLGKGEKSGGGGFKSSILADAFEAVVAAVYLSVGLESTISFINEILNLPETADDGPILDAKSQLEQWAQRKYGIPPSYEVVQRKGPDHAPVFMVRVLVGGTVCGYGNGPSKQKAEENAAKDVLKSIDGI